MPEDEKLINTHWLLSVAGQEEEILVYAAYPVYHSAASTKQAASSVDAPALISLRDAAHKVVFQAPAMAVAYMRRADVTGKVDKNASPNQVRDLKETLREASEVHPLHPFTHITASPGVSVAAGGGGQTWTVNVPIA